MGPQPCAVAQPVAARAVVVDDVRSNRELFARLLQRAGVVVVFTAENGMDALTLLRRELQNHPETHHKTVDVAASTAPTLPSAALLAGADAVVDVWFVDGNMPVMDGLERARRLRAAGICAPIVAVTGNALAEDQADFRNVGANVVLTKPVSALMLQGALDSIGLSTANHGTTRHAYATNIKPLSVIQP